MKRKKECWFFLNSGMGEGIIKQTLRNRQRLNLWWPWCWRQRHVQQASGWTVASCSEQQHGCKCDALGQLRKDLRLPAAEVPPVLHFPLQQSENKRSTVRDRQKFRTQRKPTTRFLDRATGCQSQEPLQPIKTSHTFSLKATTTTTYPCMQASRGVLKGGKPWLTLAPSSNRVVTTWRFFVPLTQANMSGVNSWCSFSNWNKGKTWEFWLIL